MNIMKTFKIYWSQFFELKGWFQLWGYSRVNYSLKINTPYLEISDRFWLVWDEKQQVARNWDYWKDGGDFPF